MTNDNRPIGIFDSGLGGLTVASAIRKAMPNENIIYLGDTARVPYGDKSPENIAKFAVQDAAFLVRHGVKAVIAACNTASAVGLKAVDEAFPSLPVIGALEAGVCACLEKSPSSIAIIGTRATISSDAYRRAIHARNPSIKVLSIAAPLFVPIVEEGLQNDQIAFAAADMYLDPVKLQDVDTLLLACTHYPLLRDTISKRIPPRTAIIDSAESCAKFASKRLLDLGIGAHPTQKGWERFFVTDMPSNFYAQARRFLERDLEYFEKVSL